MDFEAFVNDEAFEKDDEGAIIYINQLVKKFLNDPKARSSFYLESFLGLFAGSDLYDIIKQSFKINEDEREHFLPLARKCDADVKNFIFQLFKPDKPVRKDEKNIIYLDGDSENHAKYAGLDLLYAQFSPLQITGLCFLEDSADGLAVESRLMPAGSWRKEKNDK